MSYITEELSRVEPNRDVIPGSCLSFSEMAKYITEYSFRSLNEMLEEIAENELDYMKEFKDQPVYEEANLDSLKQSFAVHLRDVWSAHKAFYENAISEFETIREKFECTQKVSADNIQEGTIYGRSYKDLDLDNINFASRAVKYCTEMKNLLDNDYDKFTELTESNLYSSLKNKIGKLSKTVVTEADSSFLKENWDSQTQRLKFEDEFNSINKYYMAERNAFEKITESIDESIESIGVTYYTESYNDDEDDIPEDIKDLSKQLSSYKYGYVVSGQLRYSMEDFFDDYHSLSIKEFEKYKAGVCWDYVHYEAWWFNKNKYKWKAFYIQCQDKDNYCPSHTYLLFWLPNSSKTYYFEASWKKYSGLEEFSSESEAHNVIRKRHISDNKDVFPNTYFREQYDAASKSFEALSCFEFMNKVSKGKITYDDYVKSDQIFDESYTFESIDKLDDKGSDSFTEWVSIVDLSLATMNESYAKVLDKIKHSYYETAMIRAKVGLSGIYESDDADDTEEVQTDTPKTDSSVGGSNVTESVLEIDGEILDF